MNISGRNAIAPCGHTGETIIGTYVRCLQGCEGAPVMPRRGEPGHVLNCACRPCQIRRKTVAIILRGRDGKDWIRIDWNGADDEVVFEATKPGDIRHYVFVDADNKPVARGNTSALLLPGRGRIKLKTMMNDISGMVKGVIVNERDKLIDHVKITITLAPGQSPFAGMPKGFWSYP